MTQMTYLNKVTKMIKNDQEWLKATNNDQKQPKMTKNNKKMTQNNSRRPKMTKNDAKKQSVTDRRTDQPTNQPTNGAGCRVACTRLKSFQNACLPTFRLCHYKWTNKRRTDGQSPLKSCVSATNNISGQGCISLSRFGFPPPLPFKIFDFLPHKAVKHCS